MEPGDLRGHHVGAPTPSIQVKLKEWTDGGYSPYDKPAPRGEILISGGPITRGYYKDPVSTAESFITEPDGSRWFATGSLPTRSLVNPLVCMNDFLAFYVPSLTSYFTPQALTKGLDHTHPSIPFSLVIYSLVLC